MLLSLSLLRREAQTVWERDWQAVVPVLESQGYRVKGVAAPLDDGIQPEKMDRSSHPNTKSGWGAQDKRVAFKVIKDPHHDSCELRIMSLLNSQEHRSQPCNRAVALFDTIKVNSGADKLTVMIKEHSGPSWDAYTESHPPHFNNWTHRVFMLLEFVQYLHTFKIAHLDLSNQSVHIHPKSGNPVVVSFDASFCKQHDWSKPRGRDGPWPEDTTTSNFDPFAADIWSLGKMFQETIDDHWNMPELLELFREFSHDKPRERPSASQACDKYTDVLCRMITQGRFRRAPHAVPLPPDEPTDEAYCDSSSSSPSPARDPEQAQEMIEQQPDAGPSSTSGVATHGSASENQAGEGSQAASPELSSNTDHASAWSAQPFQAPFNEHLSDSIISQGVPKKKKSKHVRSSTAPLSEVSELSETETSQRLLNGGDQPAVRSKGHTWDGAKQRVMRKLRSIPNFFSRE